MAEPAWGKQRSPGINILLFIVTFGIYWWVWISKAFGEVARSRNRNIGASRFVPALVVIWLATIGVSAFLIAQVVSDTLKAASSKSPAANPFSFWQKSIPIFLALAGLALLLYLLQLVYLRKATALVGEAVQTTAGPTAKVPSPGLAVTFCVLLALGWIPFVGSMLSLGGLIVAIIWVIQVQGAMNQYWQTAAGGPTLPAMAYATPR